MLVLSRRVSEKVLFPSLGISVEVSRIKGNTVRLGIDAPREFRVVRAELDDDREHRIINPEEPRTPIDSESLQKTYGYSNGSREFEREREVQRNLDAVSLTVQLAQNQLRQGLSSHAEEALEQAMESLRELEQTLTESDASSMNPLSVREKPTGYAVDKRPIADDAEPGHAFVQRNREVKELITLLEQQFSAWHHANAC
jgi:carbon storage regulator